MNKPSNQFSELEPSCESLSKSVQETFSLSISNPKDLSDSVVGSLNEGASNITVKYRNTNSLDSGSYKKKLPKPDLVYVVDFFCGCGGMSWGFCSTRQSHLKFHVIAGVDIDSKALATFKSNMVDAKAIRRDIREYLEIPELFDEILDPQQVKDYRPLVFVGCPPCQGFSAHRKKDRREDPRNDLSIAFAKLCERIRPDVVVIENVPEMLNSHRSGYFEEAERIFESAGYSMSKSIVDMSLYGVPQRRLRSVVLGSLSKSMEIPRPILAETDRRTVRDAISHLPTISAGGQDPTDPLHRAPNHVSRVLEMIERIPADGGDRRSLPKNLQLQCHKDIDVGRSPGFTDVYGRLRWDAPSVTITAKSSTPSCGRFLHPEQHRNISVREAAILQGFPQNYVFEGPFTNIYRQIGEAVPPLFSKFLAWQVLDHLRPTRTLLPPALRLDRRVSFEGTHRKSGESVSFVDAFCGAGGLSLGFKAAGLIQRLSFDTNAAAVSTHNHNLGDTGKVMDIGSDTVSSAIEGCVRLDEHFVIAGGPPCQGFSQQRRGVDDDDRNDLVIRYAKVIEELGRRPSAIVLENVTYLDSPRGERVLSRFLEMMHKMNYVVIRHDMNCADFGVPQLRKRILLVALAPQVAGCYKGPKVLSAKRWPTVGEALLGVFRTSHEAEEGIPNHQLSGEGELNRRRIMFVEMGQGRLSIPPELQLPCHRRYGGHLDVYGRLDWFSQARTITGGFDSFTRGEYAHPFFHRSITPREAARLQGFPDWFRFNGNRAEVRKQIGNAVPPPLAYALGKAILMAIRGGL